MRCNKAPGCLETTVPNGGQSVFYRRHSLVQASLVLGETLHFKTDASFLRGTLLRGTVQFLFLFKHYTQIITTYIMLIISRLQFEKLLNKKIKGKYHRYIYTRTFSIEQLNCSKYVIKKKKINNRNN